MAREEREGAGGAAAACHANDKRISIGHVDASLVA